MSDFPPVPFGSRLLGPAGQDGQTLRIRIQVLLTITLIVANLIGAGVVVVLSVLVVPSAGIESRTLSVWAIATPVYICAAVAVGAVWGTRDAFRALRWVTEQRVPDAGERRAALRVPLRLTLVQLSLWGLATVLFTVLAAILQPNLVAAIGFTVGFAGIVVCANAYLLGEFALRPIAARALTGAAWHSAGAGIGLRMLLFWCLGTGVPVAGLVTVAVFALARQDVSATKLAVTVVVLGVVAIVFGMLLTVFTTRATVAPIRSVQAALRKVRHGELDVEIPVYDGTELGLLQAGFNDMVAGLRERERIRDLFGRHVGQEVARAAVDRFAELGGEEREVSVLFVDVVGSTTIAATRPPTEVVDLLNRFFAVVVDEIDRNHGLVNKFVGDAVLAIFNAPVALDDHAGAALAAARAIGSRLAAEVPGCAAGVGVATGQAVAGYVGDRRRFEYTVIGDAVNEAARLTDLAKDVPGKVLASWHAVESTSDGEAARWRPAGEVTLRGRLEGTTLAVPS
ncbi:adenylate/guanylate cyclase domain-containing protein [Amycolatopsis sp. NPDC059027]|uniref:adenylate/guanylate cyclase domain-containing protein n=1 Tax=Amycolatopsis sp. NPDC059027 TaxID=3346709 RepID=UPI0036728297